jgi:hypothetical protein
MQGLTVRWTRLGGDIGERLPEAYGTVLRLRSHCDQYEASGAEGPRGQGAKVCSRRRATAPCAVTTIERVMQELHCQYPRRRCPGGIGQGLTP